jgi:hypothetical protein
MEVRIINFHSSPLKVFCYVQGVPTISRENFRFIGSTLVPDGVQDWKRTPVRSVFVILTSETACVKRDSASIAMDTDSNDNDIVSTILGKHAAKKNPKH